MFVWEDINIQNYNYENKILVPIYNDWKSINKLLERKFEYIEFNREFSVIIVNDASTHDHEEQKRLKISIQ